MAHGLIDTFGGYRAALGVAREAAGLAPEAAITVEEFPRAKSLWELFDMFLDTDLQEALRLPRASGQIWVAWLLDRLLGRVATPLGIQPLTVP